MNGCGARLSVRSFSLLAVAGALGAVLAVLGRVPPARLPQHATGVSVLDVAFGDARAVLSRTFCHKADSYFHGGVDMDCPRCHGGTTVHLSPFTFHSSPDLWSSINARVRAPEVERHLAGVKAVEMMPWFWASVKSDPHNIDAWTAAWYSAAHVMKDDALARRILDEAKTANPDSAEIWFTEGRHLYRSGRGDRAAARASFEMARDLLLKGCGGDAARLSEADRQIYDFTGNFLRKISSP